MKLRFPIIAGLAFVAAGAIWYTNRPKSSPPPPQPALVVRATPAPPPPTVEEAPQSPVQNLAGIVPEPEVQADLDRIALSLRDFRTLMRENPMGSNAEIVRALNRGNPKKANLLRDEETVNGNGELVDRWGTPYFFHQLSGTQMEIRSAGPDRKMWTADDVVLK